MAASAYRMCTTCDHESLLAKPKEGGWAASVCPTCGERYARPLTIGLDRIEDPTAPGWPSGKSIEQKRDKAFDAFIHPATSKKP